MNGGLPSAPEAKTQARRLRAQNVGRGTKVGHAQSLELVARQYGFRDWNGLHAAIGNRLPNAWTPGGRVSGTYLSQPFEASVVSVALVSPGRFRLELALDQAIDVVTSEHFSNLRKRLRGIVGPKGHSVERTSDGEPHLQIDI